MKDSQTEDIAMATECVQFMPAGTSPKVAGEVRNATRSPKLNEDALRRADEAQARKGRAAWRLKLEAEAVQRGQDPGAPRTRVVELILNKGSAGHTRRPEADDVTRGLEQRGKLATVQAWAIRRFLEEAGFDGIKNAWENGELKLAELARRAQDIYGDNVGRTVPEIDTLARQTTGEPAWRY